MKKGNDLILSLDGVRLAASRSCSVDRKTSTIEVCSPTDGAARKYVPSTTDWSISVGGLYANQAGAERLRDIWRKYQSGQRTALAAMLSDGGVIEKGEVIMTDLKEQGDLNNLVVFTAKFQGSGVLAEDNSIALKFERVIGTAIADQTGSRIGFQYPYDEVWLYLPFANGNTYEEVNIAGGHGMIEFEVREPFGLIRLADDNGGEWIEEDVWWGAVFSLGENKMVPGVRYRLEFDFEQTQSEDWEMSNFRMYRV